MTRPRRRTRLHRRGRTLRLLAVRQSDGQHVPGAAAPARRHGGFPPPRAGWPRCSWRSARCSRPATGWWPRAACSLFVLRGVQRDPAAALGVETVFVDGEDLQQWEQALSVPTTAVSSRPRPTRCRPSSTSPPSPNSRMWPARRWCSTTSSPPAAAARRGSGADVIVYSAKHIDGQGRVLAARVLGDKEFIDGPGAATGIGAFSAAAAPGPKRTMKACDWIAWWPRSAHRGVPLETDRRCAG